MEYLPYLQVLWDYLCLRQQPRKADRPGGLAMAVRTPSEPI